MLCRGVTATDVACSPFGVIHDAATSACIIGPPGVKANRYAAAAPTLTPVNSWARWIFIQNMVDAPGVKVDHCAAAAPTLTPVDSWARWIWIQNMVRAPGVKVDRYAAAAPTLTPE